MTPDQIKADEAMRLETLRLLLEQVKPVGHNERGLPLYDIQHVADAMGLPVEVCEKAIEVGRKKMRIH